VLSFYPLDRSPTCSDQLSLYQAEPAEFERFGAKLVGISVDSIYSHGAWAAVRGITFRLLADFEPKGEVACAGATSTAWPMASRSGLFTWWMATASCATLTFRRV
jgi:peroxiredoxin